MQVVDASTLTAEQYTDIKLSILSNECQCQFEDVTYPSMGERASWSKSLHVSNGYYGYWVLIYYIYWLLSN